MDVTYEHQYDAEPAKVFAMLTDRDYVQTKVDEIGAGPGEVLECEATPDGGWRVVSTRVVELDVPGFAAKFIQPKNTVKQTDEWGPERDGVREGTWKAESRGVPISLSGTMRLESRGAGSVEIIRGKIKASVPLVGGKLEKLAAEGAQHNLDSELQFNRTWLAAH